MNIEGLISDLAFILLLGAFVTVFFKFIKQPVVLGYIVAGFLASPNFHYLPSVTTEANIDFWAEIGIVVLLFSLGLEFSFKKLVNTGASAVMTALIIVAGMMCAGFIIGHFMGFTTINSLFLGGMLSMSSTTIIIKAFTDLGLRQKKFASLVLAVLIVEDLFAVVMMVVLSSIAVNNSVQGSELLFSIAKLVFFLVIWFLVGVFVLPSLFNACRRYLNSETLLVVSMGLCLGMAVFSVYCGFSLALGAFVMGSILAGTSYAERIEHVVAPVKDLFGAVFFISVGMMVQPSIIAEYWTSILLLSGVVIVGMIIFGSFGMLVTGQTLRVAIQSGFSLTQIGEFAFIIATLGMSLGVLDATIYPIVVAVSVLTTFTTPYFIKMSDPFYNWVERHLPSQLRFLITRYHTDTTKEKAGKAWRKSLGKGLWRIAVYTIVIIAISLLARRYLLSWLTDIIPSWSNLLATVITFAAMSPFLGGLLLPLSRLLARSRTNKIRKKKQLPPNTGTVIVAVIGFIIALFFIVNVVTWCYSMRFGALVAVTVLIITILVFSQRVRVQMGSIENRFFENLNERDLRRSGKNNNIVSDLHLAYMTVGTGCELVGQKLKDSQVRPRYGVNIVSIQRGGEWYTIPGGDMRVYPGDQIGVIGTDEQLEAFLPVVEKESKSGPDARHNVDFQLFNIVLEDGNPLIGKTPRTSGLRENFDALVIAIERNEQYIDQDSDETFMPGDLVWLVGDPKRIPK
ncbi:MAG: cation:proton antiporter [Muribaculaceae bacterium]|nr:cation:proton antiporter [Muribaculaceae bacterium]